MDITSQTWLSIVDLGGGGGWEYNDAVVESGGAVGPRRGDIWKGQRSGWQAMC